MRYDLTHWPRIDLAQVRAAFREVPRAAYPALAHLSRAQIHARQAGQGGLFLAQDLAQRLNLQPGQRVLDLGCGAGTTSLFLADAYGVNVSAVDENLPDDLAARAETAGVGHLITPVTADCRRLPFAEGAFDAIFAMNSFFYFGTDDFYPSYVLRFLREDGELVIGSPCYREELSADTPEEFLLEFPACLAVHSPEWWRNHFVKTRQARVLHAALHPRGVEFWEDRVRFLLETAPHPDMPWWQDMVHAMIRMLNRDTAGFVSHFMLHARKQTAPDGGL